MTKDHPVEAHAEQLSSLRRDSDDHEVRLRNLEKVSAAREEQIKGLYENVGAIKLLVAQLGEKMDKLSENIDAKLNSAVSDLDKRLKTLESADGEKWKQAVGYVLAALAAAFVGWLIRGAA